MARIPRRVLLFLLVVGALLAAGLAIWLLTARGSTTPEAYAARSPLGRAMVLLANGRIAGELIAGLFGAAVAAGAIGVFGPGPMP